MAAAKFGRTVDADMILMSVRSIQRPTLFYWGENRYAMFVPILLSPIKNNYTNFGLLLWVHAVAFFSLFAFASEATVRLLRKNSLVDHVLAFLIVTSVSVASVNTYVLGYIGLGPNPYAASYLFTALAGSLFFAQKPSLWR